MDSISNPEALREIYGEPKGRAVRKVLPALEQHSRNFIETSPFCVLSTVSAKGSLDASPRGGKPGFVRIEGESHLLLPDFKGNNRLDSLENIVETNRAGLIFLIPGIDETLRVNGAAEIHHPEAYDEWFASEAKAPITVLRITIEEVFLHCAKAFMRSKLWQAESQFDPQEFPSIGQMLKDQIGDKNPAESRDDMIRRYRPDL